MKNLVLLLVGILWLAAGPAYAANAKGCPEGVITVPAGLAADTDTTYWLDVKRNLASVTICMFETLTAGTIQLEFSIDNGTTFDLIENTSTGSSQCFVIEHPVGLIKGVNTGFVSGNWKVKYMCGASVGGP